MGDDKNMLKINIFAVGTLKEKYLKEAIDEYLKRLSKFAKVDIFEINETKLINSETAVIEEEGKNILKRIKTNDYVILLDLHGDQVDSIAFSKKIGELQDKGISPINFVIGGTFGVSDELKKRANFKWCLSELTFTHQFTRVLVLEQIYRAFKINANEAYHH